MMPTPARGTILIGAVAALALLCMVQQQMRQQGSGSTSPGQMRPSERQAETGAAAASAKTVAPSTQQLSDAENEQVCKRYRIPEPPPYRPEKAELARALVHALRSGGGVNVLMSNTTFQEQMATLTLEERERISMEANTAVYHLASESPVVLMEEEVRNMPAGCGC